MATPKQVNFALNLLSDLGYSTRYMDSSFKSLGATMRERSGGVQVWLQGKNNADLSELIDDLQDRIARRDAKENLEEAQADANNKAS